VKSATEDASLALDDHSVADTPAAVMSRAAFCAQRFGGRWFAEAYIDGREFNVALLEEQAGWLVLPMPEMIFEEWPAEKPKIVGYRAKWETGSVECETTTRRFGLERETPALAASLGDFARRACDLLGLSGYARVDFRVDSSGAATILEVNPNPCLAPDAGFAAAAAEFGWSYDALIARIADGARKR
jgi:D-alanine-D-alanine ligase